MGLLDRYKDISPLDRNFYGGRAGEQYRRTEEAYARALRILRRQARRGDANSALAEIRVREDALNQGYTPGGIRSSDARLAQARGFASSLEGSARAREEAARIRERNNREQLDALNEEDERDRDRGDRLEELDRSARSSLRTSGLRTGSLSDAPRRLGEPAQPSRAAVMSPERASNEDDELESLLGSRLRVGYENEDDELRLLQRTRRLGSREFRSAY